MRLSIFSLFFFLPHIFLVIDYESLRFRVMFVVVRFARARSEIIYCRHVIVRNRSVMMSVEFINFQPFDFVFVCSGPQKTLHCIASVAILTQDLLVRTKVTPWPRELP